MASTTQVTTAEEHSSGRRAREVYRYFRPERLSSINENTTPETDSSSCDQNYFGPVDLPQADNSRGRSPCISPQPPECLSASPEPAVALMRPLPDSLILGDANATLNSFAQLAALRLDVDRVFISVSDRDSQFIIAQAGQTTHGTNKYDLLSEGLYAGCSTLNVGSWNMCQDTVALPPSNRERGDYSFIISNDMSEDERYRHLPLVTEDPSFRFYAGTPLTTDSSINVGSFFVLDTKPHAEFSFKERESMGHMAVLIMDFLKVSRQASEGRRAARLSRGISHFVEGRSSFSSKPHEALSRQTSNASIPSGGRKSHQKRRSISSKGSPSSSSRGSSVASGSSDYDSSNTSSLNSNPSENRPDIGTDGIDVKIGTSSTFRRAANLIRESLELGADSGVAFMETGNDPFLDKASDSESGSLEPGKAASLLAISTAEGTYGPGEDLAVPYPVRGMDEGFLHRLLNKYQQGRIWSLHRDGQLSSSDSEDGSHTDSGRRVSRRDSIQTRGRRKWKSKENHFLNLYFPGASQVMFVPLWNAANSQWFGGCFCWNDNETDVFDPSVELSSLLSFGSSIMVECSRVESLISDRQKADFLGSISHELRSPLHGILAAAEILQATTLDHYQDSLMDTINACGRTLLDTMNQVLDYSKILSLEKRFRHLNRRRASVPDLKKMHRSAAHLDTYSSTDLSILAEEVVDGVCLGHNHIQNSFSSSDVLTSLETRQGKTDKAERSKVDVTIDIAPNNWVYHFPPGALRRIIMNIFSNSMKYTSEGQVSLRLDVDGLSSRHTTQEDLIVLTVSDTGRGMSEEFLRSRLFVPFVQEDSLATGSGLGLSIVRSLLKTLGGSINVQSQLCKGTTVKVMIPLIRPDHELDTQFTPTSPTVREIRDRPTTLDYSRILRQAHSDQTVAILNTELEDGSTSSSWLTVSQYITDWFGLNVSSYSSKTQPEVDLILLDGFPTQDNISKLASLNTPTLVLSNEYVGHDSTHAIPPCIAQNIDIINRPWGPHKLARFIKKCLDERKTFDKIETITLPERPAKPHQAENPSYDSDTSNKHIGESATHQTPEPDIQEISPSSKETTNPPPRLPGNELKIEIPPEIPGARVLVVEDNKINLNLMLAFLKKRALTAIDSAENGKLAVEAVQGDKQGYDIIFMDISMPVMNGFEATRAIRAFEKGRDDEVKASTIIALTGLSSTVDEEEALGSGMDLFLTKPVAFKEVKKILDRWNEGQFSPSPQSTEGSS
ncbi:uncharacterized protein N7483_002247 [Penicillium malachiteum]|uniref:uncharacterized protein n=1 Tax=Penicillium malachiteum TaxID=1324776 RepID=UPI002548B212|nr:uncharacterized protein N7483_002247 [Penicillium malachiteum]KAJ5737122.1 hypothetical protein N7483_002247 [Penicillium malachiteum]